MEGAGETLHVYPEPAALAALEEPALRACALGYRAKTLLGSGRLVAEGTIDLQTFSHLDDDAARVVMALLPGFILQRQAFGLDDVDGFVRAVGTLLGRTPPSEQPV